MSTALPMRSAIRALAALVVVLAAFVVTAAPVHAQQQPLDPQSIGLKPGESPPRGFQVQPREAVRIAERLPEVKQVRAEFGRVKANVLVPLYYVAHPIRYEISYAVGDKTVASIHIDGVNGEVIERWTGPQAAMLLARGYSPSVGGALNRWYVWLPLALLFLLPFVDPRRPFRLLHLDLLVLLGFGVSEYFFNKGNVSVSVPLVYPLLVYLLVRLALAGFRPRPRGERLMPYARTSWLVVGLVLLMVFRVGLNVNNSVIMDVGYASVIGADRITHKEDLYVDNEIHGDTYGPITYLAYVPFELLFPNDGSWGEVPAAHAGALAFDLATLIGLMLLGTRLRAGPEGRRLGVALAFAWAAYPFTLLGLQANVNDGLVAALLVLALLALQSPAKRGLMVGLAAGAKFAPIVLAPLMATGTGEERRARSWPAYAAALAGIVALPLFLYLPDGGLKEFYDCTIGFQFGRDSVFSLWGLHPSLGWLQDVVKVAGLVFAGALAFVPRRRDLRQVAALGAAALIAAQLSVNHWFYFYIPWFTPFALLAMFGAYRAQETGHPHAAPAEAQRVASPV